MAGKCDPLLKQLLYGCVGLAVLGVILAAAGADFGFLLVVLSMAIATPALFHFAMQWPLKDAEKKRAEKEDE